MGLDSDAQASVTKFLAYFVTMWTCPPVEMVGLAGSKIIITKQGLRLLPVKASDGTTIMVPDTCYFHENCEANVVSCQNLHRTGYDLAMGHEGRCNKSTTTNSPHAVLTPDSAKVIWAAVSGNNARDGKGIVTMNVLS